MGRSRFASIQRWERAFYNRAYAINSINTHLNRVTMENTYFRVVEIIGFGGSGKTSLLATIMTRAFQLRPKLLVSWISLESEALGTVVGALKVLRDQLDFDCLLFDTALLIYWTATGQPFQIAEGSALSQSITVKTLETTGGLAGLFVPLGFAVDLYHKLKRGIAKRRFYQYREFEMLDSFRQQPAELLVRLPHFLGKDVRRRLRVSNRRLVFFYDAYDQQSPGTLAERAGWLREFIGTLDVGLHLISTREPLQWPIDDWEDVTESLRIGGLPEQECRVWLRESLGDLSPHVEDRLLKASHRLPFLVETLIEGYQRRRQQSDFDPEEGLPATPDDAIGHLLDHLEPAVRDLMVALATVQLFTEQLFEVIVRELNLPISLLFWEDVRGLFFVDPTPTNDGVHRTHDLLTSFVRSSPVHESHRRRTLTAATRWLLNSVSVAPQTVDDRLLGCFRAVLVGWLSCEDLHHSMAEALTDIGFCFYDAGYWTQLAHFSLPPCNMIDHPAAVVNDLFRGLARRRSLGVIAGIEALERLLPRRHALAGRALCVEIELAYLSELSGNYRQARTQFEYLDRQAEPFEPARRDHVRARLYHADILIMDGQFKMGSRLLTEAYEKIESNSSLDWAELVRHRGHAFRFSLLLEEAELLYRRALARTPTAPGLVGKLLTNLLEVSSLLHPAQARAEAAAAISANERLGNEIEVAKCQAALAVALAQGGELSGARNQFELSLSRFDRVGYPAGSAFALGAGSIVESTCGDRARGRDLLASLQDAVSIIGIYHHLCLLPAWVADECWRCTHLFSRIDWIGEETPESRLNRLTASLNARSRDQ